MGWLPWEWFNASSPEQMATNVMEKGAYLFLGVMVCAIGMLVLANIIKTPMGLVGKWGIGGAIFVFGAMMLVGFITI